MTQPSPGRIAIVHDYVTQRGGAERLVGEMARLLPDATVHASVVDREQLPDGLSGRRIRTTPLQRIHERGVPLTAMAPLMPTAFAWMRLDAEVVLSSTTAFAHHVRPPEGAVHVAYCHSPPHFLWSTDEYFRGRQIRGALAWPALALARRSDLAAAARVDLYVANSTSTAARIREIYGRDARVLYPPIETDRFEPVDERSGRFLVVSRLRRHKRLDLAIEAATRFGFPLDVIGEGPDEEVLRASAGPTVRFHDRSSDETVRAAMARCTALLVPGPEDFGMTIAEVQAAGRPPVAFAQGGALEIVEDGVTGFLFDEPTVESLADAMTRAAQLDLDRGRLVASAHRFDRAVFDDGLSRVLAEARG
jgi:glycosyltransferase involved in cell wall biosynthesis